MLLIKIKKNKNYNWIKFEIKIEKIEKKQE